MHFYSHIFFKENNIILLCLWLLNCFIHLKVSCEQISLRNKYWWTLRWVSLSVDKDSGRRPSHRVIAAHPSSQGGAVDATSSAHQALCSQGVAPYNLALPLLELQASRELLWFALKSASLAGIEGEKFLEQVFTFSGQVEENMVDSTQYLFLLFLQALSIKRQGSVTSVFIGWLRLPTSTVRPSYFWPWRHKGVGGWHTGYPTYCQRWIRGWSQGLQPWRSGQHPGWIFWLQYCTVDILCQNVPGASFSFMLPWSTR